LDVNSALRQGELMPAPMNNPITRAARIALVGDRSPHVMAHGRIPVALANATPDPDAVDPYWIASEDVTGIPDLAGFDGIWVVPGSPYADPAGVLSAIRTARVAGVPLLGTCAGFQHMVLEYARNVLALDVDHAEQPTGTAAGSIIVPLACSLVGEESEVDVVAGTRAAGILGAGSRIERFFCSYGLDERYRAALMEGGLTFSATDSAGALRMIELRSHPFYIGALFQPELSSDASWVHPLIRAFVAAAQDRRAHALTSAPASRSS
jgi:CTP synthase (UTP-ammonia lyase)